MNANTSNTHQPQDGAVESRIRQWINANVAVLPTFSRRDVCRITKTANDALGLGMTGGIARAAIRNFVAQVLTQRGRALA
jgi:hypothetical protein